MSELPQAGRNAVTATSPVTGRRAGGPQLAIGLDVGGSKIAAGLVRFDGDRCTGEQAGSDAGPGRGSAREPAVRVLDRRWATTPAGADAILDTCATLIDELLGIAETTAAAETAAGQRISSIGAGLPGVIDPVHGTVLAAGSTVPGWAGTAAAAALSRRTGLAVVVDNDVRMAAAGELAFGGGRGLQRALYLSLGTGVGGALVLDGTLQHGTAGTAGELAHVAVSEPGAIACGCGSRWHLESVASGPAIAAEFAQRTAAGPAGGTPGTGAASGRYDLRDVASALDAGDPVAAKVISRAARLAGAAIAGVVTLLDVDAVLLGGGAWRVGPALRQEFSRQLTADRWPTERRLEVLPAALGADAPIVGAAMTAIRAVRVQPPSAPPEPAPRTEKAQHE